MNTHDLWNGKISIEDVQRFNIEIQPYFNLFLSRVAERGLWDRIRDSDKRGMEGTFGNVTLRTYCIIGRILLTLDDGEHQITYVTDENHVERIGMQSVQGSEEEVEALFNDVVENWPVDVDTQHTMFHDSSKVKMS